MIVANGSDAIDCSVVVTTDVVVLVVDKVVLLVLLEECFFAALDSTVRFSCTRKWLSRRSWLTWAGVSRAATESMIASSLVTLPPTAITAWAAAAVLDAPTI